MANGVFEMPALLIATNGFKGTWPSIEYGTWLAAALQMKITLLGVNEKSSSATVGDSPLEETIAHAVELFQQKGLDYSTELQDGNAGEVIPDRANKEDFITII